MHEDVLMAACASFYFLGYETHAVALEASDCGPQVWHFQADVVQAFPALGDEFGDRGVV